MILMLNVELFICCFLTVDKTKSWWAMLVWEDGAEDGGAWPGAGISGGQEAEEASYLVQGSEATHTSIQGDRNVQY